MLPLLHFKFPEGWKFPPLQAMSEQIAPSKVALHEPTVAV
jgi:hypothetical protein